MLLCGNHLLSQGSLYVLYWHLAMPLVEVGDVHCPILWILRAAVDHPSVS